MTDGIIKHTLDRIVLHVENRLGSSRMANVHTDAYMDHVANSMIVRMWKAIYKKDESREIGTAFDDVDNAFAAELEDAIRTRHAEVAERLRLQMEANVEKLMVKRVVRTVENKTVILDPNTMVEESAEKFSFYEKEKDDAFGFASDL